MKTLQRTALAALAALSFVGLTALSYRLARGMDTTALSSNVAWGMWVAFYIYCIGLSAGSFLMSTLVYVFGMDRFEKMGRMALLSALFALLGGLSFVWTDLGHPFRFYKIATGWQRSSVLAWESLFYVFYIIAICSELWLLMRCDLATLRDGSSGWRRVVYRTAALGWRCPRDAAGLEACHAQTMRWVKRIGIVGIPLALGVHGGTGALFAVVAAKPYWFSGLFPIIFLVSALVSGCGLMLFLYGWFGRRDETYEQILDGLRRYLLLFVGIDLILFASDLLVGLYSGVPEHAAVWKLVMFGPYWYVFWGGQIALAWLVPLVLASLPWTRSRPFWLGLAGACVVAGIVAVRLNLVIPAYLQPQIPGLDEAYAGPRLAYAYFPSLVEWASSTGLLAALTLLFILAWRLLPMYPVAVAAGPVVAAHLEDLPQYAGQRARLMSRRAFVGTSALVGGAGVATTVLDLWPPLGGSSPRRIPGDYVLAKAENVLYSTCLQCHVDCQIKAKTWDGVLAKLTGSPYSPQNYHPHIPYETSPVAAATADGKLCPKGQAGIQTYADPYRIRTVLKRAGPRGSNRWRSIPFDRFLDEVVNGGRIFADLGEERSYPGFADLRAVSEPSLMARLQADARRFASGDLALDDFRRAHADHMQALIDPDHPDLGPRNNGFVFLAGRIEHGRKEFAEWFTRRSFGSVNFYEHTTVCEQSHHIAYSMLTGGRTSHMKPDLDHAEFVLFWGTGAFTANFGLTPMAERVTSGKVRRALRTAVVDPRLSHDAGKADWWLPIRPGTDGALALGFVRWILEHQRYDARYLANANEAAARQDGEPTWSDASYLVKVEDGAGRAFLRAHEVRGPDGRALGRSDQFVVLRDGRPVAVTPEDPDRPVEGDLFVSTTLGGIVVKSALELLRDEAFSRDLDEVSAITSVPRHLIEEVADELTSHGKRAAVELYRGAVQHTDGYYTASAVILLNVLLGNPDWRGGLSIGGGHWHESGGGTGHAYDVGGAHPAPLPAFGPAITRERTSYERWSLFREDGYPARRPWYPATNNVYQEVIPSFARGYPYPGRILLLHKGTPALSLPGGHRQIEFLTDHDAVPLFIACDVVVGETSMYADYIVPDLTYLERWGTPHTTPDVVTKTSKVRQPVAVPLTEEVEIDGERMPLSLEAFLIALGKRLDLPGFGAGAMGPGTRLDRPEDWYLKLVANIALGDGPDDAVPDATDEEMELFVQARRHLPPSVFSLERWRAAVRPSEWRKVVYVLNRGGRFAPAGSGYEGAYLRHRLGGMFHVFVEDVARMRNSFTGRRFSGTPIYRGQSDAAGEALAFGEMADFSLITYKESFGGHSRTVSNYWANLGLQDTNHVLMNRRDAERLGLRDGQRVRLLSTANPSGEVDLGSGGRADVAGPLAVVEGIAPGTVAVSWHYGHWAYGSRDTEIDGVVVPGDPRRAAGLCPNPVMAVDAKMGDVCLSDPIGGSTSFYDSKVAVVPADQGGAFTRGA